MLPPTIFSQKRRKSENFEEKLKIFQQLENCPPNPIKISPLPPVTQSREKNSSLGQKFENENQNRIETAKSKTVNLDLSRSEAKKCKDPKKKIASSLKIHETLKKIKKKRKIAPPTHPAERNIPKITTTAEVQYCRL